MANSGPGGTWLSGTWERLQLPVVAWRAWTWEDGELVSRASDWEDVPDAVLAVLVAHPKGRATWMWYVDGYPAPPGEEGPEKAGLQLGEVHGPQWDQVKAQIKLEAETWRRLTT